MKVVIGSCLALALSVSTCLNLVLSAQTPALPERSGCALQYMTKGSLDGHWWVAAAPCERLVYMLAYTDGSRLEALVTPLLADGGIPSWPAIDRFFKDSGHLNVPIKDALRTIWSSADAPPSRH
jgi:hypothetical protein